MGTWREHKSVSVNRNKQGMIFFFCQNYKNLPKEDQTVIDELCIAAGKGYEAALFEYMTTPSTRTKVVMDYYLSEMTLTRAVNRFISAFPDFTVKKEGRTCNGYAGDSIDGSR